jgi:hypothetical protein
MYIIDEETDDAQKAYIVFIDAPLPFTHFLEFRPLSE